jgi:ferredoxin-NADP reductase
LEALPYRPGDAVLLYRAASPADFVFRQELDALAARRGIRLAYLHGRRPHGRTSWLPDRYQGAPDTHVLRHLVPDIAEHDVYVCGPEAWTAAVVASAQAVGVTRGRIHTESFAW